MPANRLSWLGPKWSVGTIVVLTLALAATEGLRAPSVEAAQPDPAKPGAINKERRFESTQSLLVFQNAGDNLQPKFLGMTPTLDGKGIVVPDDESWYVVPTGPGFTNTTPNAKPGSGGINNRRIIIRGGGLLLPMQLQQLQQLQMENLKRLQELQRQRGLNPGIGLGGIPLGLGIGGLGVGGLPGMPGGIGIIGEMPGGLGLGGLPPGFGGVPRVKPAVPKINPKSPKRLPNEVKATITTVERESWPGLRCSEGPVSPPTSFVSADDTHPVQIVVPRVPPLKIQPPRINQPRINPPRINQPRIGNGRVQPGVKRTPLSDALVQNLVAELRKGNVPGVTIDSPAFTDAHLAILTSWGGLKTLNLHGTAVTDDGLQHLIKLPALRNLTLDGDRFSAKGLAHLKVLSLTSLALSGSRIDNAAIAALQDVKDLKVLRLRWARVDDAGLKTLAEMKSMQSLETLDLLGQQFSDAGLFHLPALKSLSAVRLYLTQVSNVGLGHLTKVNGLTRLTIDCCSDGLVIPFGSIKNGTFVINGVPATTFAKSPHNLGYIGADAKISFVTSTGHINLPGGNITDEGLRQLKGMKSLRELEIGNWKISDAGLDPIGDITDLQLLKVDSPSITNRGLIALKNLTKLETLDLRCSSITGAGAGNLRGLTKLKTLFVALGCTDQDLAAYREALPAGAQVSRGNPFEELNLILGKDAPKK